MELYGDYHTHTIFSHGSGTIEDNIKAAKAAGLKQIAITDHGLKHVAFGLRKRKIIKMQSQIDLLRDKYSDINILLGVEANITSLDGQIDMTEEEIKIFDIILCGYHKFVWPKTAKDYFHFFTTNYFYDTFRKNAPDKVIKSNTQAIINNIKKFPVDVLTHINYGMRVNCQEVAKACADYGTYLEINGKRISYSDKEMEAMLKTGVNFIVNSDAHSPERVGEISLGIESIKRLGIPLDRVVNLNSLPVFRSQIKNNRDKL